MRFSYNNYVQWRKMKDLRQNKADAVHEHVVNSLLPINSKENIRTTYRKTVFGAKFRKYVKQFAIVTAAGVLYEYYQFTDGSEIYTTI